MKAFLQGSGRVTGSKYLTLPPGHRTTLVTGMSDMLDYASLFVSDHRKAQLDALQDVAKSYESDALRQVLDAYMDADRSREKFLIVGCFVAALEEQARLPRDSGT